MYESYWKLTDKPFALRFDANRFYGSKSHHGAMLRLKYGIDHLSGPNVVLGLSGTGKSSLVRVLAEKNSTLRPFVHVVFPTLECTELLRVIAEQLSGQPAVYALGTDGLLKDIQKSLHQHCDLGCHPVVCLDDAHLLSDDALQMVVQPLVNLTETDLQCPLSIILVGQPVLGARLRKNGSLSERIAVTTAVQGFTASETADYVTSSLQSVGGASPIFTPGALARLFEVTGGNPRRINRLCEMALLVGYAEQLSEITEAQIDSVGAELIPSAA